MTVRTEMCSESHAMTRLAAAESFLEVALLVADEADPAFAGVTASLAVLAGIAASDAACCIALGRRSRGESHHDAVQVLREIQGGDSAAEALRRLIGLKDSAQYGLQFLSKGNRKVALRQAEKLVVFARDLVSS